jgi:hypothetical protein
MTRPGRRIAFLAYAAVILAMSASPLAAADPGSASTTPLVASYWDGFVDHWMSAIKKQNGVILVALGVGAVSLFIITRGKWRKG